MRKNSREEGTDKDKHKPSWNMAARAGGGGVGWEGGVALKTA